MNFVNVQVNVDNTQKKKKKMNINHTNISILWALNSIGAKHR